MSISAPTLRLVGCVLDSVDTTDVTIACSTRKLHKEYMGPCMRVRRDPAKGEILWCSKIDGSYAGAMEAVVVDGKNAYVLAEQRGAYVLGSEVAYPPAPLLLERYDDDRSTTSTLSKLAYGNGAYRVTWSSNGGNATVARIGHYVFDNDLSTVWEAGTYTNAAGYTGTFTTLVDSTIVRGEWVQIQLPEAVSIVRYGLTPVAGVLTRRMPGVFTVAGSNDGITWTAVDSRNIVGAASYKIKTLNQFLLPTPSASYTYYRLITTKLAAASGTEPVNILEWRLYGNPTRMSPLQLGNVLTVARYVQQNRPTYDANLTWVVPNDVRLLNKTSWHAITNAQKALVGTESPSAGLAVSGEYLYAVSGATAVTGAIDVYHANGTLAMQKPLLDVAANTAGLIIKYGAQTGEAHWAAIITSPDMAAFATCAADDGTEGCYVGGYMYRPPGASGTGNSHFTLHDAFGEGGVTLATSPAGACVPFVGRYNATGNVLWACKVLDSSAYGTVTGVASNTKGGILVAGQISDGGNVLHSNGSVFTSLSILNAETSSYIAQYDGTGNALSGWRVNASSSPGLPVSVTLSASDIYVSGQYHDLAQIYHSNAEIAGSLVSGIGSGGFLVNYDLGGNVKWWSSLSNATPSSVSASTDGVVVGGKYVNTSDIYYSNTNTIVGTLPSSSFNQGGGFVVHYSNNSAQVWSSLDAGAVQSVSSQNGRVAIAATVLKGANVLSSSNSVLFQCMGGSDELAFVMSLEVAAAETDIGFLNRSVDVSELESHCPYPSNGFVTTLYSQLNGIDNAQQLVASRQPQIVTLGTPILQRGAPFLTGNLDTPYNSSFIANHVLRATSSGVSNVAYSSNVVLEYMNYILAGYSYGSASNRFFGAAQIGTRLILPPFSSSYVGIVDLSMRTLSQGALVLAGTALKFTSAEALRDGAGRDVVVFAPDTLDSLGLYYPMTNTYVTGPKVGGAVSGRFYSSVKISDSKALMIPYSHPSIGIYDAVANTYSNVVTVSSAVAKFDGGALVRAPQGNVVVMAPLTYGKIGLYNVDTNVYSDGPSVGAAQFRGATVAQDKVVFAPSGTTSTTVGVYDPTSNSYTATVVHATSVNTRYTGCATLGNTSTVLFTPFAAPFVGQFDIATMQFSESLSVGTGTTKLRGALYVGGSTVIMMPSSYASVGAVTYANRTIAKDLSSLVVSKPNSSEVLEDNLARSAGPMQPGMFAPSISNISKDGYIVDSLSEVAQKCIAAFSFRRLRRAYSGPVVRLRRSDNVERDFLGEHAIPLWLGSDHSAFVKCMYDQSGNGLDAVQPVDENQPRISLESGRCVLEFNGASFLQLLGELAPTSFWAEYYLVSSNGLLFGNMNNEFGFFNHSMTGSTNGTAFLGNASSMSYWWIDGVRGSNHDGPQTISINSWKRVAASRRGATAQNIDRIGYLHEGYLGELVFWDSPVLRKDAHALHDSRGPPELVMPSRQSRLKNLKT